MVTLVVGAGGFVGGYLVKELESAEHKVVAADIPEVNLLNRESVENLVKKVKPDYVANLAAISSVGMSWKDPVATMQVNVVGSLNLLDAITKYVPKAKTLLVGSAEEYAPKDFPLNEACDREASSPYGISKIAQENFAELYRKKYGAQIVCTRSFNHTGVGQKTTFALPSFVKQVADIENSKQSGVIKVGNLNAWRDFSDVRDVVHVYRMLLENKTVYDVYNVGSGIAHKIGDLLDVIIGFASVKIEIVQDSEKMRPIDIPYQCCDNSRITECGYWMGTPIEETLKWMFNHQRKV